MPPPLLLKAWPLQHLGIEHAARRLAEGKIHHHLAGGPSDVAEKFLRPGDAMRRKQHVVQFTKSMRCGHRLLGEAIYSSTGNAAFLEGRIKRILIHNAPAGGIEQISAWFHPGEFARAD